MPAPKQGESFVLKHRLAGAGVLIGFAVIVLPILLGGPGDVRDEPERTASSGGGETKVFRSNITPIGGATPDTGSRDARGSSDGGDGEEFSATVGELLDRDALPSGGDDTPDASPPPEASGTDANAPVPSGAEGSEAAPTDTADAGTPAEIERGWIVQVGTFAKSGNASKLVADLENGGFGASTTDVETSSGSATRVWIGPFETRVEAARARTRVTQRTGSEALIVAYP